MGARTKARARIVRLWRRAAPAFRSLPRTLQLPLAAAASLVLWLAANGVYQVARKPSELLFPVSGTLSKTPRETWTEYEVSFRAHATAVMTPSFLAALAQVEGAGNPVARTYWRWRPTLHPFEVYRPASSGVGMYQITDATFREARRYCIRDNAAIERGPWYDLGSCWFNGLYTRVVPTHAVEMTSALLDIEVARVLRRRRVARATLRQKQDLAAVIHLCGARVGVAYAARGFRLVARERCGDQAVRAYLSRVHAMQRDFARLAAAPARPRWIFRTLPAPRTSRAADTRRAGYSCRSVSFLAARSQSIAVLRPSSA